MSLPKSHQELYDTIIDAARRHGENDEPDHEVGDLQQAVETLLRRVPPSRLDDVRRELSETLTDWPQEAS
jgi:hypothetical protein